MIGLIAGCAAGNDSSTSDEGSLTGDSSQNHCDHCPPPPPPPAKCQYAGISRAVDIHLLPGLKIPLLDQNVLENGGIHVPFSDASIGPSGGHAKADLLDLQIPNLLRARVLDATVDGANCRTDSVAEIANVEVGLSKLKLGSVVSLQVLNDLLNNLGLQADIQADVLKATASASCKGGKPVLEGDSIVAKLRIGNNNILEIVPGKANQKIELLGDGLGHGITIVINEQLVDSKGNSGSIQTNALHVNVLDLADVVVAGASAGITCGGST
ncbi:hypothetical protein LZC95_43735 [Pendulispora brunnea]|uniref:Uncharacterized protein n=1 Tax=Pendulispora brunnea TaxID=2905690 RepID=A0ABZ2K944_9BACT